MRSFWILQKSLKGVLAKFHIWTGPQLCPKFSQKPEVNMYYKKQIHSPLRKIRTKRNVFLFSSFSGSITVEAAFVLPLFLFFCIQLISIMCLFELHSAITAALHQEVLTLSLEAYAYEQAGVKTDSVFINAVSDVYLTRQVIQRVGEEYLDASMIDGGSSGIRICFDEHKGMLTGNIQDVIDVTLTYRVKPLFGVLGFTGFSMTNRCRMKAWTGYRQPQWTEGERAEEEFVYVTENGNVYHKSRQCTHLVLSIREAETDSLTVLRNEDGAKYYACEVCGKSQQEKVFLTDQGNRYHTSLMCSGLKRTIYVIRLSEAGGRGACSRCAGMS